MPLGGNYRATQAGDGTWTIHDVPIMAELPKGTKNAPEDIGVEWFEAAIAKCHASEVDGHLPRLHAHHHDKPGRKPEGIGFFRLTRTGPITLGGESKQALFADLIGISDEQFQRFESLELPYRSVEIKNWALEEVRSVALLETEDPFFRLPMVSVGDKQTVPVAAYDPERQSSEPLVASFHSEGGDALLFEFGEPEMAKKKTKKKAAAETGAQLEDDDKPKDKEGGDDEAQASEGESINIGDITSQVTAAVEEHIKTVVDSIPELIAAALAGGAAPDDESTAEAPAELEAGSEETVKLEAKNAGLEARIAKLERKEKITGDVDEAIAKFEADGYTVTDAVREKMAAAAEKDALPIFCETYREHAPKDPAETLAQFEAEGTSTTEADSAEVMHFAADGPNALEMARELAAEHGAYLARGGTANLKEYLAINMEGAAV